MPSSTPSGIGKVSASGRRRVLGVAAGAAEGHDPLAGVLAHAGHLAARHERQLLGREVVVAALVGVGEVHTRARDPDEDLALAGLGDGEIDELQDLRAPELLLLDGAHGGLDPTGAPNA